MIRPTQRRNAGLALHYTIMAVSGFAGTVLIFAGRAIPDLALGIGGSALLLLSISLFGYSLLRDTWNAAMFALVGCLALGVFVWPFTCIVVEAGKGSFMSRLSVALGVATLALAGYLARRRFGAERAPDFLVDGEVYEIDGICIRWDPECRVTTAGGAAFVTIELQNNWACPARCEVELRGRRRNRNRSDGLLRGTAEMLPGEYGALHLPVRFDASAIGTHAFSVAVRGRPSSRWRGRLRLRPKPTLPVGPMGLMTVIAAVAGELVDYRSAGINLVVSAGADQGTGGGIPRGAEWERRWVPPEHEAAGPVRG